MLLIYILYIILAYTMFSVVNLLLKVVCSSLYLSLEHFLKILQLYYQKPRF